MEGTLKHFVRLAQVSSPDLSHPELSDPESSALTISLPCHPHPWLKHASNDALPDTWSKMHAKVLPTLPPTVRLHRSADDTMYILRKTISYNPLHSMVFPDQHWSLRNRFACRNDCRWSAPDGMSSPQLERKAAKTKSLEKTSLNFGLIGTWLSQISSKKSANLEDLALNERKILFAWIRFRFDSSVKFQDLSIGIINLASAGVSLSDLRDLKTLYKMNQGQNQWRTNRATLNCAQV